LAAWLFPPPKHEKKKKSPLVLPSSHKGNIVAMTETKVDNIISEESNFFAWNKLGVAFVI
jgi:hypothetical protein